LISFFTEEDISKIPEIKSRINDSDQNMKLEDFDINKDKVIKVLSSLKVNKAAGVDGLPSTFLSMLGGAIVEPLTILFKRSLDHCEIPVDWKRANISAIFKKGSKKDPGNYRPVSLTSHAGKLFEKLVKEEIVQHLERNKLINSSQHGFMQNKSCLTNLLEFNEYVLSTCG